MTDSFSRLAAEHPEWEPADAGLQPERTSLAWTRTYILLIGTAALTMRWAHTHGPIVVVPFVGTVLLAIGIRCGHRARYRRAYAGIVAGRVEPAFGPIVWLTIGVTLLAISGVVLTWW